VGSPPSVAQIVACELPRQSASVAQYFPTPSEFPAVPTATHPPESTVVPPSLLVPLSPVDESEPAPLSSVDVLPPVLLELLHATAPEIIADATKAIATICFCMLLP
jgi:hypothetical protein